MPTPIPVAVNTPTPQPTFMPTPPIEPSAEPTPPPPELNVGPRKVFDSHLLVGATFPLGITETYPTGGSDLSIPFDIGGDIDLAWVPTDNFGVGLNTHAMSYKFTDDDAALNAAQQILHQRDDYELAIGPIFRLPFPAGFEMYLRPGFAVRSVGVTTTAQPLDADGNPTGDTPAPVNGDSYLTSGFLAYGGQIQGGVGWRILDPLSVAVTGEYNYLLAGGLSKTDVQPSILPLTGFRAGAQVRLDFAPLGLEAGYNLTSWSGNPDLSQSWNGPYLKVGLVF